MRMWEIRENTGKYDSDYRMGMKHKESKLQEAYDCGYDDGYEKAMEEIEEKKKMGERTPSYKEDEPGYRRRH